MVNYDNKILIINLKLSEMKKFKTIKSIAILLLFVSGLFLTSCSKKKESLAIPKDANSVGVIDVYSLVKKGKLHEIEDLEFFKAIKKEVRNESKKSYKMLNDLIEDPGMTGLNFKEDVFFYIIDEANDEKFISFLFEVKNRENFENFIEALLDEAKMDLNIEKEKNYSYVKIQNESIIGWDENKVIILVPQNYKSKKNMDFEIETLMQLKEKDKIVVNDNFNEFYKNKKDLSVWFSSNSFEGDNTFAKIQEEMGDNILKKIFGRADYKTLKKQNQIDSYLSGSCLSLYLDFQDNSVSLLSHFTPNEEVRKIMKDYNIWDNSFNSKLLNYFPKKSYFATSFSVDLMEFYNILKESDDFEKHQLDFEKETGFEVKELFETFKGSGVFSFWDIDEVERKYMDYGYNGYGGYGGYEKTEKNLVPIMGLAVDINDDKIIKKILKKIPEESISKRNNYYKINNHNEDYDLYFAFDDKVFFITNDKKSIKAFEDGGYSSDNLGNSDIAKSIKNNKAYMFFNLNYQDYPETLKNQIQQIRGARLEKALEVWDDFAKSIEVKQIDENSFEVIFNTKEKEGNSLNTIISTISESYETLLSL